MTDTGMSRRRAFGVVGLGALISACSASPAPTTSAAVPTTGGGSATVAPQTSAASDLFPDSGLRQGPLHRPFRT